MNRQQTPIVDHRLLDAIGAGNCVAFVGAGFSAAAGLPSWVDLLRFVANSLHAAEESEPHTLVSQLLAKGNSPSNRELEMAAQLLFDALGEERFRKSLAAALHQESLPESMQQRLKHLYGIPFRAIVTTNFDPLIPGVPPSPAAYRRLVRSSPTSPWKAAITKAALGHQTADWQSDWSERPIIQLHGTLGDAGSLVFTRSQYRRRLYSSPAYLTVLRSLLASSTVLFLGYSLNDAYLNELRAELVEAFQGQGDHALPVAWAVLENVSEVARVYYEKHEGLGVLTYPTRAGGRDHSGFDQILEAIYKSTNPIHRLGVLLGGRRLLWFDPNPDQNEIGWQLLGQALAESQDSGPGSVRRLEEVETLDDAIGHLNVGSPVDLILSHWGHGLGPEHRAKGEELLRHASRLRAGGKPVPPILIFAGQEHEEENRRRALGLGAVAFSSHWEDLMANLERLLSALPSGKAL